MWCSASALCLTLLIQAKGGSIAFIKGKTSQTLVAYLNGDREYVLFDPYDKEAHELNMTMQDDLVGLEENGGFTLLLLLFFRFVFNNELIES